jgi:hypothetical protein
MKRNAVLMTAVLLAALALAPACRASNDPLGGGATRIVLDRSFLAHLRQAKVALGAIAPARRRAGKLILPVSGGTMDPTVGRGQVESSGGFVFKSARKRLPLRALTVKTTHAPLVAKVGGSQLKVATSARLSSQRHGFGSVFSAKQLKLTAKAATRLNKKLRPAVPFFVGQLLGTLRTAPLPRTVAILPSGRATFVFSGSFISKLDSHFVSVNPIFPAEHTGPTFTLPLIPGGAIAPDASSGVVRTGGEIEFLQLGAGQIFWHELWFDVGLHSALAEVDIEPSPPFPGKLGQVPALGVGTGAISSSPGERMVGMTGSPVTLPASTADSFNQAFSEGKSDFQPGESVGTVSFSVNGQ